MCLSQFVQIFLDAITIKRNSSIPKSSILDLRAPRKAIPQVVFLPRLGFVSYWDWTCDNIQVGESGVTQSELFFETRMQVRLTEVEDYFFVGRVSNFVMVVAVLIVFPKII